MDSVAPITDEELKMYEGISFDVDDFKGDVGSAKLVHEGDKAKTLMARWRNPSLSIHGIQVSQNLLSLRLQFSCVLYVRFSQTYFLIFFLD